MKIFKLLSFAIVLSLAFVSCSKDDDGGGDNPASVSGNKYETTYAKIVVTNGTETETLELKSKAELEEEEMYSVIEFKADGKFYADGEQTGTWTQSGATVSVLEDGDTTTGTLSGNKFNVTFTEAEDGYSFKADVEYTKM